MVSASKTKQIMKSGKKKVNFLQIGFQCGETGEVDCIEYRIAKEPMKTNELKIDQNSRCPTSIGKSKDYFVKNLKDQSIC
ncbi:Hypothetical predicted protein [Octopus vulgaris]|uniref:Uncharacterized protein n=1 Tax=Octopus vulgaris TaxID=6645 RepID=A0AA36FBT0_OCTVU|nr:Hypothetical predicted protein [Octopus vulgaris]